MNCSLLLWGFFWAKHAMDSCQLLQCDLIHIIIYMYYHIYIYHIYLIHIILAFFCLPFHSHELSWDKNPFSTTFWYRKIWRALGIAAVEWLWENKYWVQYKIHSHYVSVAHVKKISSVGCIADYRCISIHVWTWSIISDNPPAMLSGSSFLEFLQSFISLIKTTVDIASLWDINHSSVFFTSVL